MGPAIQLEHALLAVVRANSMNEVLFAPMCGLVLVTKAAKSEDQLHCFRSRIKRCSCYALPLRRYLPLSSWCLTQLAFVVSRRRWATSRT